MIIQGDAAQPKLLDTELGIDPLILAYLAGVIDSDGCIRIGKHKYGNKSGNTIHYSETVIITQVEIDAINLAQATFGGSIHTKKQLPGRKQVNQWTIGEKLASYALKLLLPYLRIKRRQAENCLRLREIKRESKSMRSTGNRERPEYLTEKMEQCFQIQKGLNMVGVDDDNTGRCEMDTTEE